MSQMKKSTILSLRQNTIIIWQNTERSQEVLTIKCVKNFVIIKLSMSNKHTYIYKDKEIMTEVTMNELYCIIKQEYKDISSETQFNNERIIATNMTFKEVEEFILRILDLNEDI
jgi:RecB family endonuclease NucS